MLEACRTCLKLIDVDNLRFFEIESDDEQLSAESCRSKLLSLIPEMALNITPKSLMCIECHGSLEAMFEFKAKCQQTENIITQYFRAKPDVDLKNLDLKDVSTFNMSHFSNTSTAEDEAVNAFIEDFAIEEKVKSFDDSASVVEDESITIVKHEVDENLFDNVKVMQPVNTVLESKKDPKKNMFSCHICLKSFNRKDVLKNHISTHTNERPYKCIICLKRFNSISNLNNHVKIHSKHKKYKCEVCEKMFGSNRSLKIHSLMHTKKYNFVCKYCSKRFLFWSFLKKHLDSHEKPHCCEVCDRRFARENELTIHLRRHNDIRPYTCTICDKSFTSKKHLKQHGSTHIKNRSKDTT